eukprot:4181169-Alexandrium_andersonii.AAC.1
MSASLVGSEMCIRDRHPPQNEQASIASEEATASAQDRPAHPGLDEGLGPVSYTHLTLPTICSV